MFKNHRAALRLLDTIPPGPIGRGQVNSFDRALKDVKDALAHGVLLNIIESPLLLLFGRIVSGGKVRS
jgi:hypothetical protein